VLGAKVAIRGAAAWRCDGANGDARWGCEAHAPAQTIAIATHLGMREGFARAAAGVNSRGARA
jgi:hypothetical protein